jgi:predicted DNA-binding transcriptional regulator AlpA
MNAPAISDTSGEQWLTMPQVAEILQLPMPTLRKWRLHGEGPRFVRFGKHLRCDPADLRAFIAERKAS